MCRRACLRGISGSLAILLILALVSCAPAPSGSYDDPNGGTNGSFVEVSELFVATSNPGETRVLTNDERYWSANGYTVWTVWNEGEADPFTTRTVTMAKSLGEGVAGYGLVICQVNRPGIGNTMLTVMINVKGQYTIGKVIDGSYQALVPWKTSSCLKTNYGLSNTITVTYDAVALEYTLTINGNVVQTFKDESEPRHTGGKNGYIVVFSPYDTFPSKTVDVLFTESK